MDNTRCTACGACAEKCPTKVPNEFNFGLDERKAIYKDYAQGIPSVFTIDPDACKVLQGQKCGVCAKVCQAKAVDYEQKDSYVELNVASVIVSTGYELFDATQISEYGYGKLPNVISSLEMERLLSAGGPTKGHLTRPSVVHGEARLKEIPKLIKKAEKSEDAAEAEALASRAKMAGRARTQIPHGQEAWIHPVRRFQGFSFPQVLLKLLLHALHQGSHNRQRT